MAENSFRLLARIARATKQPVEDFFDPALAGIADQRAELLRLWDTIGTDAGRVRALAALRAIAGDDEGAEARSASDGHGEGTD